MNRKMYRSKAHEKMKLMKEAVKAKAKGNMKGSVSNNMFLVGIAFVVVIVLASVWFGTQYGASSKSTVPTGTQNQSVSSSVASACTALTGTSPLYNNAKCAAPNVAQTFSITTGYFNYSKPVYGGAVALAPLGSQTINRYNQYPTVSGLVSGTATSSSTQATSLSLVAPGVDQLVTACDNSGQQTYFMNYTYANPGSASLAFTLPCEKYSAPTLIPSNIASGGSTTAVQAVQHSITIGASQQYTLYLAIKAGLSNACEFQCLVSFTFNNLAIQSISLNGQGPVNPTSQVPSLSFVTSNTNNPTFIYLGAQNKQLNYLISGTGLENNFYSTGVGGNGFAAAGSTTWLPVVVQTTAAIATNELIGVAITPSTELFNTTSGYINDYGAAGLFTPINSGQNIQGAFTTQSGANIFSPVYTNNAFVLQTN